MLTQTLKIVTFALMLLVAGVSRGAGVDKVYTPRDMNQILNEEIRVLMGLPQNHLITEYKYLGLMSYSYKNTGDLRVMEANSISLLLKNYMIARLHSLELAACPQAR